MSMYSLFFIIFRSTFSSFDCVKLVVLLFLLKQILVFWFLKIINSSSLEFSTKPFLPLHASASYQTYSGKFQIFIVVDILVPDCAIVFKMKLDFINH